MKGFFFSREARGHKGESKQAGRSATKTTYGEGLKNISIKDDSGPGLRRRKKISGGGGGVKKEEAAPSGDFRDQHLRNAALEGKAYRER